MTALGRVRRFSASHAEDWVVWTLRAALVAGATWAIVAPRVASGQTVGGFVAAAALGGLALALAVSAAPARNLRALRVVEAALLIALALHVAGHVFGFYTSVNRYDSWVHGIGGFLAGVAALALVRGTELFLPRGAATRFRVAFVALGLMAILGMGVEILEFANDELLGTSEQTDPVQRPLQDTMWDLIAEVVGGLVAVLLGLALTDRGRVLPPYDAARRLRRGA